LFNKNPHTKLFDRIFTIIILALGTLSFDLYRNCDAKPIMHIYLITKIFVWIILWVLVRQLYLIIYKDELTELWNRRYLHIVLDDQMKRLKNKGNLTLAMIDIDNFKGINDNYGHLQGDRVLFNLSNLLERNVRGNDMVFRWGGEEFIILLPNTDEMGAVKVLERLRKNISEYDFNCKITISCGIVSIKEATDISQFIGMADKALYEAKKVKNNIVIYQ